MRSMLKTDCEIPIAETMAAPKVLIKAIRSNCFTSLRESIRTRKKIAQTNQCSQSTIPANLSVDQLIVIPHQRSHRPIGIINGSQKNDNLPDPKDFRSQNNNSKPVPN